MYQPSLSISMTLNILLSEGEVKRAELIDYVQNFLQFFIHNCFFFLVGRRDSFTVCKIDGLLHLSEDLRQFG